MAFPVSLPDDGLIDLMTFPVVSSYPMITFAFRSRFVCSRLGRT